MFGIPLGEDLSKSRLETRILVDHLARFRVLYLLLGLSFLVALLRITDDFLPVWEAWALVASLFLFAWPKTFRQAEPGVAFFRVALIVGLISADMLGTVLGLFDVFDRSDGARLQQVGMALPDNYWNAWHIAVATLAGMAAILLVSVVARRLLSRIELTLLLIIASLSCEVIAIPSALTRAIYNSGEFLDAFAPSLIIAGQALYLLVWGYFAILALARRQDLSITVEPATESSPSDKYVAAGSGVAVTALLVAFFGLTTCWGYAKNLESLITVRSALASDLVAAALAENGNLSQALKNRVRTGQLGQEGTQDAAAISSAWHQEYHLATKPVWLEDVRIVPTGYSGHSMLDSKPAGVRFSVWVREYGVADSWFAAPILEFPKDLRVDHDLPAAAACTDTLDAPFTSERAYRACEKSTAVGRGVKLPLIQFVDAEFPVQFVIVVAFVALAGCLLILSDRIETILELPPSKKIEPWILLDASLRGSRWLANGWVLALVAAPWLLISFAVGVVSLKVRTEGSVSSVLYDATMALILLSGVGVCAYLSQSVLGGLVTLRRIRHYQLLDSAAAAPVAAIVPNDLDFIN